jgi:putative FmdB family regulatory protein
MTKQNKIRIIERISGSVLMQKACPKNAIAVALAQPVHVSAFSATVASGNVHKLFEAPMPIYEFACPKCRRIFNFLSKRVNPDRLPACPKCGNKKLSKQVSRFAMTRGLKEPAASVEGEDARPPMPDFDDPRVERAMMEMERDMENLDENNPRHMAHMMKKMKDLMPPGSMPKEMDVAIKRLEAGEDPEKIEADMGDLLGDFMGGKAGGEGGDYTRDSGLYDY